MKIHYHSDHLGSASFVTNAEGAVVQHLQYLPYGELFVSQRNTEEFDSRYKFTAKELDNETSYTYFGARYYDSELSGWLSVDPMSDKYPSLSPYCYTADNPVVLVDPNGMEWKDIEGNEIKEHNNIKVYIFYDPKSFKRQTMHIAKKIEKQFGEGSVALSDATTTKEFAKDWSNMSSSNIKEVDLNYHGSPQTINLDWETSQYITSTFNGKTPIGNPAINVSDLPKPKGNISYAQLNINSCRSNDKSDINRGLTIAKAFRKYTNFYSIRTTTTNVSYFRLFGIDFPHPQDNSKWEYLYLNKNFFNPFNNTKN